MNIDVLLTRSREETASKVVLEQKEEEKNVKQKKIIDAKLQKISKKPKEEKDWAMADEDELFRQGSIFKSLNSYFAIKEKMRSKS